MLDLAKMNGSDKDVGLIEENLNAAPEAAILPARIIKGTSFKTLVRTAYPLTGFRQANGSTQPTKSTYVNKMFETFYYDGQMEIHSNTKNSLYLCVLLGFFKFRVLVFLRRLVPTFSQFVRNCAQSSFALIPASIPRFV